MSDFPETTFEGVRFNVISVMRKGVVGVKYPGKGHYVTLEWPQNVTVTSREANVPNSPQPQVYTSPVSVNATT